MKNLKTNLHSNSEANLLSRQQTFEGSRNSNNSKSRKVPGVTFEQIMESGQDEKLFAKPPRPVHKTPQARNSSNLSGIDY